MAIFRLGVYLRKRLLQNRSPDKTAFRALKSDGGRSEGGFRDSRSNCPRGWPWRSSGSESTCERGCCKIGRRIKRPSELLRAMGAGLKEASETPAQTAQEAGHGDLQARSLLAKEAAAKSVAG